MNIKITKYLFFFLKFSFFLPPPPVIIHLNFAPFEIRRIRSRINILDPFRNPITRLCLSDIKSHISKYQRRNNGIFPWRERAGMESVSWKCGTIRTNTHTETQRIMRPPREICLDLLKSISKLYDAAPSVTLGAN